MVFKEEGADSPHPSSDTGTMRKPAHLQWVKDLILFREQNILDDTLDAHQKDIPQ